ncbi:MAG: hypothetical protein JWN33_516 [Candidatus Saccharibacteria bacterium]|nr:hypothetical protein [Candidatus Saccharibacteria bacterium]
MKTRKVITEPVRIDTILKQRMEFFIERRKHTN